MRSLHRIFNDLVRVAVLQLEMKFAASNPGEIEQVVNQSGLQFHVALYNLDVLDELWGKFLRVILQVGGCCQSRRQRRAQFMAERCQKVVLSLTSFLRCDFFRFKLAASNLVGYVARDFRETPNVSRLITKRGNDNLRFERRSVLADAQALITNLPPTRGFAQVALRFPGGNIVCCVEGGEVLADDFLH